MAYSLLLKADDASRAVQDALLSAIYTPGKLRADETFEIWLAGLTVRACQDTLAKHARERLLHLSKTGGEHAPLPQPAEGTVRPSDEGLWLAFEQLNEEQRIQIVLRYFQGFNIEQMARICRVGKSTISARLGSARDKMMHSLYPVEPTSDSEDLRIATISHDRAKILLQAAADEPLPSQEWVPLQSHVDQCDSCRVYRKHLQAMERDLPRMLRLHLEAPPASTPIDPEKLLARQRSGLKIRTTALNIAKFFGTLLTLGIGIFLAYSMFIPPPAQKNVLLTPDLLTQIASTPEPSATAALAVPFRNPVIYQSTRDGNTEIYLHDPLGEDANLTQNPAEDVYPSWSPDGNWIAFISNRTGKNEIYVMLVSGTQLFQLTDSPDIDWQGPISWASNGKRLAVAGKWLNDSNRSWIYLVSLNGDDPVIRLSFSRDSLHPQWSPGGIWLAYEQNSDGHNQIIARRVDSNDIIHLSTGQYGTINYNAPYYSPENGFTWMPDGSGLVFILNGPYMRTRNGFQLTPGPNTSSQIAMSSYTQFAGITGNTTSLQSAPIDRPIISASSSGNILAYLQVEPDTCNGEGWHLLNLVVQADLVGSYALYTATPVPTHIPNICVALPLSDFSLDTRWALAGGQRHPGE